MKIKILITCVFFAILLSAFSLGKGLFDSLGLPIDHRQIVLVTTDTWGSPAGIMGLYEMEDSNWIKYGSNIEVVVGENGLAWGKGVYEPVAGLEKKEGDGKAPAGIFEIGDLFGYAKSAPTSLKMNYRQLTSRDYFIDDVNSVDYNQWKVIPSDKENLPKNFWDSYERMKRTDHLYELGFVIKHNVEPIIRGKGSAIFFHVWRKQGSPTSGCTAMRKEDLIKLITWLDPNMKPLIIQVTKGKLDNLKFKITK